MRMTPVDSPLQMGQRLLRSWSAQSTHSTLCPQGTDAWDLAPSLHTTQIVSSLWRFTWRFRSIWTYGILSGYSSFPYSSCHLANSKSSGIKKSLSSPDIEYISYSIKNMENNFFSGVLHSCTSSGSGFTGSTMFTGSSMFSGSSRFSGSSC